MAKAKQADIQAAEGRCILVVEKSWPGSWGRGASLSEALKKANKPKKYIIFDCLAGTYVNGMCDMCHDNCPEELQGGKWYTKIGEVG